MTLTSVKYGRVERINCKHILIRIRCKCSPERKPNQQSESDTWLVRALSSSSTMIRTTRPLSLAPRSFKPGRLIANTPPQVPPKLHGHLPTSQSPIVSKLHFFNSVTGNGAQIPTYRVIDGEGKPIDGAEIPEVRSFVLKLCFIIHEIVDWQGICPENVRPEHERHNVVNLVHASV